MQDASCRLLAMHTVFGVRHTACGMREADLLRRVVLGVRFIACGFRVAYHIRLTEGTCLNSALQSKCIIRPLYGEEG